jgi:ABC-type amino acid transport substrate-binding protein
LRRSDDAMIDAINAALDRMIGSGALARLYAKYGVDYRQP